METEVVAAFVVCVRLTDPEMCGQDWNIETPSSPGSLWQPKGAREKDQQPVSGSCWLLPSLGSLPGPGRASPLPQSLLDPLSPALSEQQCSYLRLSAPWGSSKLTH